MSTVVKTHFSVRYKNMLIISLLVVLLVSSVIIVYIVKIDSDSVSFSDAIHVTNEAELRNTISNAQNGQPIVIALDRNIVLKNGMLVISDGKDITLTSDKKDGFYDLIGASGSGTLVVDMGGILRLDGIRVTSVRDFNGPGVIVYSVGTLVMHSGEISNNKADSGGGVINYGYFSMSGGKISDNSANIGREQIGGVGGGVYNDGTFTMSGGEISSNVARSGGGVANQGNFSLSGGKITNNKSSIHSLDGGGVINSGNFIMSGGAITENCASWGYGSGVTNLGNFTMSGGKITNNKVSMSGGSGVYNYGDNFTWVGGTLSNNGYNDVSGYTGDVPHNNDYRLIITTVICVISVFLVVSGLFLHLKKRKNSRLLAGKT